MQMDLPDAALFNIDDPAKTLDDFELAPGGVMEKSTGDSILMAEQQSKAKKRDARDDWGGLHNGLHNDLSTVADSEVTDDGSRASLQAIPKNSVVPFQRHRVPCTQG